MLRAVAWLAALALLAGGLALAIAAAPGAPPLLVFGLLLAAGLAWEQRYRRAAEAPPAAEGWQRTAEVFIDPESGERVRVWTLPATGQRRYVREA